MDNISLENIRQFRLHTHHLDTWYEREYLLPIVSACGLQNSSPGAWETAVHNRISGLSPIDLQQILEEEKSLLQAWSFRGAPVIFPTAESAVFLSALVPQGEEPWVYTRGIQLALDSLEMPFLSLLSLLQQVLPRLNDTTIQSKTALDQTLAGWMLPLLPECKRECWNAPSPYGNPEKQTVGGAVVSFLLRPASFLGLVVFAKRTGISPTFTGYQSWVGTALQPQGNGAIKALAKKYLHCYGPATVGGFATWLGCSPTQAKRMWQSILEEIQPVQVSGKERYILKDDATLLLSPPQAKRELHLLGGHDPYLGLEDRDTILIDKALQRKIWQTVSNPGAILQKGKIIGMWKSKKKPKGLELSFTLWEGAASAKQLETLGEQYAAASQNTLLKTTFLS
ncbi:winged helix DNA-binding domain-containing protein [Eubacteriales bacterium OttesenSCG-928-M02]|nr:winged helix DNA-binding domain-containing protein [Eubacteriales bacterium OttesenSCG-928-M02]